MFLEKTMQGWKLPPVWLRFLLVVVLSIGLFFRFIDPDYLVYSYDESYTSLRISGHTRTEIIQQEFNNQITNVGEFYQKYQTVNPDKGIGDTVEGLALEEAQLTPLYFTLVRVWAGVFGSSVTAIRSFSGIISLLLMPCAFWLCLELFGSALVGWVTIALMAVSPFHVLYAKDARPYILLAAMILLSSAVLLWALRSKHKSSWVLYGSTIALGLYTHLLFFPVMVGHGIYVLATQGLRLSKSVIGYALASLAGVLAFVPWIVAMITNSLSVVNKVGAPGKAFSLLSIFSEIKPLSRYTCRIFLDTHWAGGIVSLGTGNRFNDVLQPIVGALLIGTIWYAFYWLCRHTKRETWLFVVLLAGVTLLALLAQGGIADRYLFAYYLAVQLAIAHLLATHLAGATQVWQQKIGQVALVTLLTAGIASGIVSAHTQVWSIKFPSFSEHNPAVARIINQAQNPLLIIHQPANAFTGSAIEESVGRLMSLSHLLQPNVQLQLTQNPATLKIPERSSPIFLYRPSKSLRNTLEKVQGYQLKPVEPANAAWLWQVEKKPVQG